MRCGVEALLQDAGRTAHEIDHVIIAGAFGSYIDVSSAMTIGMLPNLPLERFRQVGNAAGTGARLASSPARSGPRHRRLGDRYAMLNWPGCPTSSSSLPVRCTWETRSQRRRGRAEQEAEGLRNRKGETEHGDESIEHQEASADRRRAADGADWRAHQPQRKKKLAAALQAGNMELVRLEAISQVQAGADILDINVGLAGWTR